MRRHLVRWHETYAQRGLVIIEVTGGRFEKLDVVRRAVHKKKVRHKVLWDRDCQNTDRYGVTSWPIAYLIGRGGQVVWEGNPARVVSRPQKKRQLKKLIETELDRQPTGREH